MKKMDLLYLVFSKAQSNQKFMQDVLHTDDTDCLSEGLMSHLRYYPRTELERIVKEHKLMEEEKAEEERTKLQEEKEVKYWEEQDKKAKEDEKNGKSSM